MSRYYVVYEETVKKEGFIYAENIDEAKTIFKNERYNIYHLDDLDVKDSTLLSIEEDW